MVPVPLELKDDVHHVLEDLGARNGPLLRDVPHKDHGGVGFLGVLDELGRRFPYLRNAPGRGLYAVGVQGLDRIDDHHFGVDLRNEVEDVLGSRFGQHKAVFRPLYESLGPHLYLRLALLA